jgi:hypothetical protein
MKYFILALSLLGTVLSVPTCNECDPAPLSLYAQNGVSVSATPCSFEIKYQVDYPVDQLVQFGLMDGSNTLWDVYSCNNDTGGTGPFRDGVPSSRNDIAEVECLKDETGYHLLLDLYRPILHLRGQNVKFPFSILVGGVPTSGELVV